MLFLNKTESVIQKLQDTDKRVYRVLKFKMQIYYGLKRQLRRKGSIIY